MQARVHNRSRREQPINGEEKNTSEIPMVIGAFEAHSL